MCIEGGMTTCGQVSDGYMTTCGHVSDGHMTTGSGVWSSKQWTPTNDHSNTSKDTRQPVTNSNQTNTTTNTNTNQRTNTTMPFAPASPVAKLEIEQRKQRPGTPVPSVVTRKRHGDQHQTEPEQQQEDQEKLRKHLSTKTLGKHMSEHDIASDGEAEDDDPEPEDFDGNECFHNILHYDDYIMKEHHEQVFQGMPQAMFQCAEPKKSLWACHMFPDAPGFLHIHALDAFRLKDFLAKGNTWWRWKSPLALPPVCFEAPASHLAPFKGLSMALYRAVWIGFYDSTSIHGMASKHETMKLILTASALYSFVHNLDLDHHGGPREPTHPIPDPMRFDARYHGSAATFMVPTYVADQLAEMKARWETDTRPKEWDLLTSQFKDNPKAREAECWLETFFDILEKAMTDAVEKNVKVDSEDTVSNRGKSWCGAIFDNNAADQCYLVMMATTIISDFIVFLDCMGHNSLVGVTSSPYTALYYLGQQVREIMLEENFNNHKAFYSKLATVARQICFKNQTLQMSASPAPKQKRKLGGPIPQIPWNPMLLKKKWNFNIEDPMHRVPFFFKPEYTEFVTYVCDNDNQICDDNDDSDDEEKPAKRLKTEPAVEFPCGATATRDDTCSCVTQIALEYANGSYLESILDSDGRPHLKTAWDVDSNVATDPMARKAANSRKTALTNLRKHWAEHHNGQLLPLALQLKVKKGFGPEWSKVAKEMGVPADQECGWIKRAKRAFKSEGTRVEQVYSKAHTGGEYVGKIADIINRKLVVFTDSVPKEK